MRYERVSCGNCKYSRKSRMYCVSMSIPLYRWDFKGPGIRCAYYEEKEDQECR